MRRRIAVLILVGLLAACGGDDEGARPTLPARPTTTDGPGGTTEPPPTTEAPDDTRPERTTLPEEPTTTEVPDTTVPDEPTTTDVPPTTEETAPPTTEEPPPTTEAPPPATTEPPPTTEEPGGEDEEAGGPVETTTTAPATAPDEAGDDEDSFAWLRVLLVLGVIGGVIAWLVAGRGGTEIDPRWRAQATGLLADLERSRDGLLAGAQPDGPVPDAQWRSVMDGTAAARATADTVAAEAPSEELRAAVVAARDAIGTVELTAAAARSGASAAAASLGIDAEALAATLRQIRSLLGPEPTPPAP